MQKQDKIERYLAYGGKVSVICADTTNLVEKARKTHDLSPVVTAAFGRLLTISSIMGNEMKSQKDKLTIQIKANGPIGMMVVTANNIPKVKGYVTNPQVDIPLNEFGKLDVGNAVGNEGYKCNKRYRTKRAIHRNFTINLWRNCRWFCKLFC